MCACVCVRVYIFMQWVFKELSTEAGFPQTTITSTPGTPHFLSWYFFFLFIFFCFGGRSQRGEPPTSNLQDWDALHLPVPAGALSRLEQKLCGTGIFWSTRWEELKEWRSSRRRRKRDSALLTWAAACRFTCPGAGLRPVAPSRRSLSILSFFFITIGWRMKLSWTEGLPSLSTCVMKKK